MRIFVRRGGVDFPTQKEGKWHHGDLCTFRKGSRGRVSQVYKTGLAFVFAGQSSHYERGKDHCGGRRVVLEKKKADQFRRRNKSHRGGGLCHAGLCFKFGVRASTRSLLFRGCGLCCDGGLGGSEKEGKRENYRVEKMCKAKDDY